MICAIAEPNTIADSLSHFNIEPFLLVTQVRVKSHLKIPIFIPLFGKRINQKVSYVEAR
jgi:hypothetical protein